MSGKAKFIGISLAVLFLLLSLTSFYLMSGTSDANTKVIYTLDITAPSSRLVNVSVTIEPNPLPFVDLYLRDPIQNGRQRIQGLRVTRDGRDVLHWQAIPGFPDMLRVWNGFQTEPLFIEYKVDPLWLNGQEVPGSYLDGQFGYLRGMVILYSPISMTDIVQHNLQVSGIEAGFAEMKVQLPTGWEMVSPWGSGAVQTPAARLRDGYMVLGSFTIQDLLFDNTPFLAGVYKGIDPSRQSQLVYELPALFENMLALTGFAPVSHTCFWSVAVLPQALIHETVSGTGSLVVNDNLTTIARAMFHWWNGETLLTTNDAAWLKEGFTLYYAAKALRQSGIWTEEEFSQEMSRFAHEISTSDRIPPLNLISYADQLTASNELQAYDAVAYGGGLLAYSLDLQLANQGKSLDLLWPALAAYQGQVSSQIFLSHLEQIGGPDLANACADMLNGKVAIQIEGYSVGKTP